MIPDRWKEITPSQFPWEREALEYVRQSLPDHDPYRAWSNFEFIANDGSINEIDLLVVTSMGFFMVEIKSRPGHLSGDPGTWVWKKKDGRFLTEDNPLFLTNRKAKKLASLLRTQKAFEKVRSPFLEALVFCSAENLTCSLKGNARFHICFRNESGTSDTAGIKEALINRNAPGLKQDVPRISKPQSRAIGRGLDQIGIRPSQKSRKVGDYKLEKLIFQCPKDTYQDWEASHTSLSNVKRRVRIYNVALTESQETRSHINKAAEREFRLLNRLQHEGILHAENYTQHSRGPALVYPYDRSSLRLDLYLSQYSATIGVDIRLSLIRQIAEAVKFAHGKGVIHRALSPQSILVSDAETNRPRIKILNWQAGRRVSSTTSANALAETQTVHPDQLMEDSSLLYMSPEVLRYTDSIGEYVDVFSLGAISYHVFTGKPPASSLMELRQKLFDQKGLDISSIMDGSGSELCDLIQISTNPDVLNRFETMDDFLEQLQLVEDEFTEPDEVYIKNPLDAQAKDRMKGGFLVKERLGKGGSATVFLVEHQGKEVVLKLANRAELNDRLNTEYNALKKQRYPLIVEVFEPVQISGLSGFTMQRAGTKTLAQRLREEGHLQLEFLQRFGRDLLQIVEYLENNGIYHRDIKSENIGIGSVEKGKRLRLSLFDFSLAETRLGNIHVGTPKYHDPFIRQRKPVQWDLYAERFTAAMTLYEMATGTLPTWGDGQTDPEMLDCEASIASEMFDSNIRKAMTTFFTKAFKRDSTDRFDNAEEMLNAWGSVFRTVDVSSHHDTAFDQEKAVMDAALDTRLVSLGLSPQALSALEHKNVLTVRNLLDVPFNQFRVMRGVGFKTKKEVLKITHDLHRANPGFVSGEEGENKSVFVSDPKTASVDVLAREIDRAGKSHDKQLLRLFLGREKPDSMPFWPSRKAVANSLSVDLQQAMKQIDTARQSWRKMSAVTRLREDIRQVLEKSGGVMCAQDLADAVLAARGSVIGDRSLRDRFATAVVRAALESERGNQNQAFSDHRGKNNIFVSINREAAEYAEQLGKTADDLAGQEPLTSPAKAIEMLRRINPPEGQLPIQHDNDLLRLAVSASEGAALSGKLEIYPKRMSAIRMLRLAQGALAGCPELTIHELKSRVQGRYPKGESLPDRPELDQLLDEVGLDLKWHPKAAGEKGAYVFIRSEISISSTGSTFSTVSIEDKIPYVTSDEADAGFFDSRLEKANTEGSFLVLSVAQRSILKARGALMNRFALKSVNFDELFIPVLKEEAEKKRIRWEVILRADAAEKESQDWQNLQRLVSLCMPRVEEKLSSCNQTILLTGIGLMARYDQLKLIDDLRDKAGVTGGTLEGLWILVPESAQSTLPTVDGKPIPVLTSGQHARIPKTWIKGQLRND